MSNFITLPFFSSNSLYKVSSNKILNDQEIRRIDFSKQIYELKRHGYINTFVKAKEKYIEITPKGKTKISKYCISPIEHPKHWDKKWRVAFFDIPEEHKTERDIFRKRILKLGFVQIQKSVYVHPFECAFQIKTLSQILNVADYVKIMISEIIQGEEDLIAVFVDKNILSKSDLNV